MVLERQKEETRWKHSETSEDISLQLAKALRDAGFDARKGKQRIGVEAVHFVRVRGGGAVIDLCVFSCEALEAAEEEPGGYSRLVANSILADEGCGIAEGQTNRLHSGREALVSAHNRRAWDVGSQGDLTPAKWAEVIRHFDGCAYCGKRNVTLALEHVIPISHGGGTTQNNVVPACVSCNCAKGTKHVLDWLGDKADAFVERCLGGAQ